MFQGGLIRFSVAMALVFSPSIVLVSNLRSFLCKSEQVICDWLAQQPAWLTSWGNGKVKGHPRLNSDWNAGIMLQTGAAQKKAVANYLCSYLTLKLGILWGHHQSVLTWQHLIIMIKYWHEFKAKTSPSYVFTYCPAINLSRFLLSCLCLLIEFSMLYILCYSFAILLILNHLGERSDF